MGKCPQPAEGPPRSPLFAGLSHDAWQDLVNAAVARDVAPGTYLFHQGDPPRAGYLVLRGRLKIAQVTPEGHEIIVATLGPGDIAGLIALLARIPYPAAAQAAEATRVLVWHAEVFWALLERHPRLALNALRVLAGRFRELQDRYRELATERVEQRVARCLLRLARKFGRREDERVVIDYPLSREDIAELTGTTLYTVSRILRRWEEQGIVALARQRVAILSPHGLVALAEGESSGSP